MISFFFLFYCFHFWRKTPTSTTFLLLFPLHCCPRVYFSLIHHDGEHIWINKRKKCEQKLAFISLVLWQLMAKHERSQSFDLETNIDSFHCNGLYLSKWKHLATWNWQEIHLLLRILFSIIYINHFKSLHRCKLICVLVRLILDVLRNLGLCWFPNTFCYKHSTQLMHARSECTRIHLPVHQDLGRPKQMSQVPLTWTTRKWVHYIGSVWFSFYKTCSECWTEGWAGEFV